MIIYQSVAVNQKKSRQIYLTMIEFKKISDFPKGTLYSQLADAYSFHPDCKTYWDKMWKEYDDFFYSNLDSIADKCGFITTVDGIAIGHISWDPRKKPAYVSIGHNCTLHGCKINDNVIVGMGSIILNGANIGENCIIGAGSLITQNKSFEPGKLILGSPAKAVRDLTKEEINSIKSNANEYIELKEKQLKQNNRR